MNFLWISHSHRNRHHHWDWSPFIFPQSVKSKQNIFLFFQQFHRFVCKSNMMNLWYEHFIIVVFISRFAVNLVAANKTAFVCLLIKTRAIFYFRWEVRLLANSNISWRSTEMFVYAAGWVDGRRESTSTFELIIPSAMERGAPFSSAVAWVHND